MATKIPNDKPTDNPIGISKIATANDDWKNTLDGTNNVAAMFSMFRSCSNLKSILVDSTKWKTPQYGTENMFLDCGTNKVSYA